MQAKLLKSRLLIASKAYYGALIETRALLKLSENNLEALLLRGKAYYYIADHDIATRFVSLSDGCSKIIVENLWICDGYCFYKSVLL